MDIRRYITPGGVDIFGAWLSGVRDPTAKAAIAIRITRLATGNPGDRRSVGGGVFELRIDVGPGYRLYYARVGAEIVLLLCGGNKRRQDADIQRAKTLLDDYERRTRKA